MEVIEMTKGMEVIRLRRKMKRSKRISFNLAEGEKLIYSDHIWLNFIFCFFVFVSLISLFVAFSS